MDGVVRGEQVGVARQVIVGQTRGPKTQRGRAQGVGQQAVFGIAHGAYGEVGVQQGVKADRVKLACLQVNAPVVERHGQIEQPGIDPGEVKVEHAGERIPLEQHVVAKQIGVNRAARQRGISGRCGDLSLVRKLSADEGALIGGEIGQDVGDGAGLPGEPAQIGLRARVVACGQMHACQPVPHLRAVHRLGLQLAAALQARDQRGGFAFEGVQGLALPVGHGVGYGNAMRGQMVHQPEVERQLLGLQALEQGEHEPALCGAQEIVGVFDPAGDALQVGACAQIEAVQPGVDLCCVERCENGHERDGERKGRLEKQVERAG